MVDKCSQAIVYAIEWKLGPGRPWQPFKKE